jgi:superfamily II DNA or RNA helicase
MSGSYPGTKDAQFNTKIAAKKEFKDHISKKNDKSIEELCSKLNAPVLFEYQKLLRNYLSPATPYQNTLLYALAGTGKTISSIAIAETHIPQGIKVYVLLEDSVRQNFYDEYKMYTGKDLDKRKIKVQTLGKFTNVISGLLKTSSGRKEIKENYSNSLIIIDEVHNIRENTNENTNENEDTVAESDASSFKRYNAVKSILSIGSGNKLLLMSATPMYDNPREIVSLINLFLVNSKEPEIDVNAIFDSLKLTSRGEKIIREKLRGIVSHVRPDTNTYPSMSFPKDAVSYPFLKDTDIRIIECKMSERHEMYYRDNISDHINVVRQNSNVIGTDNSPEELTENKLKDKKSSISTKFYKLLKSLKDDEGSAFIYSEFISGSLEKIKDILLANGFDEYNPKKASSNKPTFVFLDGGLSLTQRTSLIDTFNNTENKDGKIIKVVLGSRVLKEGITLKNVRHVHIMEPWHNISRLQQIWGRAIRACSHVALSKSKRNVMVHLYASTFGTPIPSKINYSDFSVIKDTIPYDIIGYYRSVEKQIYIEKIIRVLREIAFDCLLNKEINANDVDNILCDGKLSPETDTSTYTYNSTLFEEPEVAEMILKIQKSLDETKLYKIPSVQSTLIKKAIKSLIANDSSLILRGKYIIVNPKGVPRESAFYTKLLGSSKISLPKIPYSSKYTKLDEKESGSRRSSIQTRPEIPPIDSSISGAIVKNNVVKGKYRGILKDNGVFLLQDTTIDTRVSTGRECKSFVGKDLHNVISNIGIPSVLLESQIQGSAFKSKGKICEIIKTFYYPDQPSENDDNNERELVGYKFRLKTINNTKVMTIADTTKLDKGGIICLTMKTETLRNIASLLKVGTSSTGRKDLCDLIHEKVFG